MLLKKQNKKIRSILLCDKHTSKKYINPLAEFSGCVSEPGTKLFLGSFLRYNFDISSI